MSKVAPVRGGSGTQIQGNLGPQPIFIVTMLRGSLVQASGHSLPWPCELLFLFLEIFFLYYMDFHILCIFSSPVSSYPFSRKSFQFSQHFLNFYNPVLHNVVFNYALHPIVFKFVHACGFLSSSSLPVPWKLELLYLCHAEHTIEWVHFNMFSMNSWKLLHIITLCIKSLCLYSVALRVWYMLFNLKLHVIFTHNITQLCFDGSHGLTFVLSGLNRKQVDYLSGTPLSNQFWSFSGQWGAVVAKIILSS